MVTGGGSDSFREELRLFLESVCCDLCRFEHVATEHIAPEDVVIRQEVAVGPSAFADIQVTPKGTAPYFVEIDYGYTPERLIESLRRKYGELNDATAAASKVVLVIDVNGRQDWPGLEARARSVLRPSLALEVWDEHRLDELVRRRFGVSLGSLEEHDRLELRVAVDRAKGRHAFGDDFSADALESTLLWHFGFWRLRQLREAGRKTARDILPPGLYPNAVIVTADLSGYTRFVRDTRHDDVVRRSLTAFASRTRYQIINAGGMLYQFLGDSVIAIFGIPEAAPDDAERGFACATALIDIGASVAIEWQRQIDQIQPSTGVHVAMATGDLQVIEFRPFSRTRRRRRGCDQPRRSSVRRRGDPRDRREQQPVPPAQRPHARWVPRHGAGGSQEPRVGARVEARAASPPALLSGPTIEVSPFLWRWRWKCW